MADRLQEPDDLAADRLIKSSSAAVAAVNDFTRSVFRTRGGRIGSGMGGVIEGLWGFYVNAQLLEDPEAAVELAWIYGHEYNDFACIHTGADWDPADRKGELFRVEAKSMVLSAAESKAHFDRLQHELDENEILAVFLWDWSSIGDGSQRVFPKILDFYVGRARPIASFRDQLHLARGGSFVQPKACPDGCPATSCSHVGEPLNAKGTRERKTGPASTVIGKNAKHSANFGGMLRMLASRRSEEVKQIYAEAREEDVEVRKYTDLMARWFPKVAKFIE